MYISLHFLLKLRVSGVYIIMYYLFLLEVSDLPAPGSRQAHQTGDSAAVPVVLGESRGEDHMTRRVLEANGGRNHTSVN